MIKYKISYKEATDMCNRMFGVESINFESVTCAHIKYAEPLHATLKIDIDPLGEKISNASVSIIVMHYYY
jgi:recombinational DNA repair protein RecT